MTNLRKARLERGLKQRQVAEATGITQPLLSDLESGRLKPGREMLRRLARALDVPVEWLDERY
jgi:transcriptional regulator with XRE-family HTH domain